MAFPLNRIQLGPHAYGPRPGTFGVTIHTTEYPSSSLAHGLQCVRDQSPGGSLYAGGGSYGFVLTDEGPILAVPYLEAAGGISGDHTPPSQISPRTGRPGTWAPDRFAWLKAGLPLAAYNDPNAYMLQLAVSGQTAALQNYPHIGRIIDDAARIILWAQSLPEVVDSLLVHGHMHWQTDRSDPGQWFLDQVKARIAALTAPQEADMPTPTLVYVPQLWKANAGGAELRAQASLAAPVIDTIAAGTLIFTVGEDPAAGPRWRLAVAGDPARLLFVRKAHITALPPLPRDQALFDGIVDVVDARAAGLPVPSGSGITPEQVAQAERLSFGRGRDEATAAYTAAGVEAAKAVAP